jgi:hypothetical protein
MLSETNAKPIKFYALLMDLAKTTLAAKVYRIFYPTPQDITMMGTFTNPWKTEWCPLPKL